MVDSPAAVGGLENGDVLLEFGPVKSEAALATLPEVVRDNIGKPLVTTVMRHNTGQCFERFWFL